MTTDRDTLYASIRLETGKGFDTARALEDAATVLRDLDTASGNPVRRARRRIAVMADRFAVSIRPPLPQDGAPRALIRVIARDGAAVDDATATAILARTVQRILGWTTAIRIDWCAPASCLPPEGFAGARAAKPAPGTDDRDEEQRLSDSIRAAQEQAEIMIAQEAEWRASRNVARTVEAAVDTVRETVRERIVEQAPPERRLSLASWLMTVVIGSIHAPIGVMLGIIGLARGMNFRSVTRVLTGVALFAACQSLGLFDQVTPALLR